VGQTAKRGFQFIGIDLSIEMLEKTKTKNQQNRLAERDFHVHPKTNGRLLASPLFPENAAGIHNSNAK